MEKRESIKPEVLVASVLDKLEKMESKVRQLVEVKEKLAVENLKFQEENQRLRNEILAQTVKILELEQDLLLEQTKKQAPAKSVDVATTYSSTAQNEQDTGGGILESIFEDLAPTQATQVEKQTAETSGSKTVEIQQKSAALKAEIDQYIAEIDRCIEWLQQH